MHGVVLETCGYHLFWLAIPRQKIIAAKRKTSRNGNLKRNLRILKGIALKMSQNSADVDACLIEIRDNQVRKILYIQFVFICSEKKFDLWVQKFGHFGISMFWRI